MGFFSKLFTAVFQPVNTVVQSATQVVNGVTAAVDTTAHTVATTLAPIPVVGTVLAEASQQVNYATNYVDTATHYANSTVGTAGYIAADTLDLNLNYVGQDIGAQLNDTFANDQLLDNVLNNAGTSVSSIFDFG